MAFNVNRNGSAMPSMIQQLSGGLNGMLFGGYQNFGNQLQNAMGAFGSVAEQNSLNNQALNNANLRYANGYQSDVDRARLQQEGALATARAQQEGQLALSRANQEGQLALEQLRQQGSNQRFSQLSPLLSGLFGGGAGGGGSTGGGAPAGMTGFSAVGADGQPFASAGASDGTTGNLIGSTAQPDNDTTAQPTDVNRYLAPNAYRYGQQVAPQGAPAAMARYRTTRRSSPAPVAKISRGY